MPSWHGELHIVWGIWETRSPPFVGPADQKESPSGFSIRGAERLRFFQKHTAKGLREF